LYLVSMLFQVFKCINEELFTTPMVKYGTSLIRPQGGFYVNYNI